MSKCSSSEFCSRRINNLSQIVSEVSGRRQLNKAVACKRNALRGVTFAGTYRERSEDDGNDVNISLNHGCYSNETV